MITQKMKYALKALLTLADEAEKSRPEARTIKEIVKHSGTPKRFLEHILLEVRNAGVIASIRGRSGGYNLIKRPTDFSISDLLRAIDGPIAPLAENIAAGLAFRRLTDLVVNVLRLPLARAQRGATLDRVREVADWLHLTGDLGRIVGTWPYGLQKRVELARALIAEPKLLPLDEPIAGMTEHNLDRHRRNARTHTLHDPVRWKYAILGNYYLNEVKPPLHAWS